MQATEWMIKWIDLSNSDAPSVDSQNPTRYSGTTNIYLCWLVVSELCYLKSLRDAVARTNLLTRPRLLLP